MTGGSCSDLTSLFPRPSVRLSVVESTEKESELPPPQHRGRGEGGLKKNFKKNVYQT